MCLEFTQFHPLKSECPFVLCWKWEKPMIWSLPFLLYSSAIYGTVDGKRISPSLEVPQPLLHGTGEMDLRGKDLPSMHMVFLLD